MQHPSFRWPPPDVLSRLVRDAQGAHHTAVGELVAVIRPALMEFFGRHRVADADDLAQRTCLRVIGALPRIDSQRADAYISTVARNVLRTALRTAARNRERGSEIDANHLPARTPAADTQLEYEELVLAVHRASLILPQELRSVVIGLLRGETPAEIAAALSISPVTVRTRLMRVRAILRPELAPYLDLPSYRPTNSVDQVSQSATAGHG